MFITQILHGNLFNLWNGIRNKNKTPAYESQDINTSFRCFVPTNLLTELIYFHKNILMALRGWTPRWKIKASFRLLIWWMNHFRSQVVELFLSGVETLYCEVMSYSQCLLEDDISRIGPLIPNGAATATFHLFWLHKPSRRAIFGSVSAKFITTS